MIKSYFENQLYELDSQPLGRSWQNWVKLWWRWCYTEPKGISPVSDRTGTLAGKNQNIPNVWFLGGTFGGKAERTCVIPRGRSILVPLINDLISFAEFDHLKNEHELRNYAKDDINTTSLIEASIDRFDLKGLRSYRIQSDLFSLIIPLSKTRVGSTRLTQAIDNR